ncbi:MAG TPA: 4-(cytidine 5'-diphospho)-2-C-methyl-D-erythritol kinase [Acholeplasmatales bacterium]|nr:4-(cytidine 5'-diphospho)-2-C-methyl-D-erythritol kinase [Acholeplasmatales bacterium]
MVMEKGYAKINLGLEVIRKREDGYHDLAMVMTPIDLYDELYFEDFPEGKQVKIDCDKLAHIPLEDNLIYKAVSLIKTQYNVDKGVKIRVVKRIPEQAGLAGGSADAAATLRALNGLWNLDLNLDQLAALGAQIGSDVPFCIYNRTAKVTGRGENIEFIETVPFAHLILIIPPLGSSTSDTFKKFIVHNQNAGKIDELIEAIRQGNINVISEKLFNDLEYGGKQAEINRFKRDLVEAGALGSLMTGSGSAIYGICFNEKQTKATYEKLRFLYQKTNHQILMTTIRSLRKPNLEGYIPDRNAKKTLVQGSFETKAQGMVMLGYHRIRDNYRLILTPVGLYDSLSVCKLSNPVCEVFFGENEEETELTGKLKTVIAKTGYGLRVRIANRFDRVFGLFAFNNYLACIISGLGKFGTDPETIYPLFPKIIKAYSHSQTFEYDSKTDSFELLGEAVFGHVLVSSLNLRGYQSPRYTEQVEVQSKEMDAVKEAIAEKNFYKMADNVQNGISRFETRAIREFRRFPLVEKTEQLCLRLGASGFVLSADGRCIICFCRFGDQAKAISRNLQIKHRMNTTIITTIRSSVKHQPAQSETLHPANAEEVSRTGFEEYLNLEIEQQRQLPDQVDYEKLDYEEGSPFDNETSEIEKDEEPTKPKSRIRKKIQPVSAIRDSDLEGILYLHSGGSLFKQYDFVDIARYFEKYFHGKSIKFIKDQEEIEVLFVTNSLPHILGIHLLDEKDPELRGRRGFQKLISGEISYYQLKRSGRYSEEIIRKIYNKTQSSVLIFNDIFNNRPLSCFDKSFVKSESSKMENLEFVITRRLTETSFRRQNLLGIGKDPSTDSYYFNTSFLWEVPADIGQKDSIKIQVYR